MRKTEKRQAVRPILVLGGTGHYGQHIVRSLVQRGQPVRVLSRDASRAKNVLGEAVEVVAGNIADRWSAEAALDGVRAVVVSVSAFTPQQVRQMVAIERDAVLDVLAAAERAGVGRVVYMSVFQVDRSVAGPLRLASADIKVAVEDALACSSLNWTVLGAPPSMEIFFAMIRGDTMVVPGGGPPALPTISPVDVGAIAAEAALRDDLGGCRFPLAGPELLSFPEAARRIAAHTGRPIHFRAIPLVLPRLAAVVIWPLAPLSSRLTYVQQMLGFIKLLNRFPPAMAMAALEAHRILLETFDYTPTTFDMEIARRYPPS